MESAAVGLNASKDSVSEFRRGWLILLVATLALGCGALLPMYSLSLFVEPLEADFGWTRTAIIQSNAYLTAMLFVMAPFVGRLIDRFEVRRVAVPSIVLTAVLLAAFSQLGSDIRALHLGYGLLGVVAAGMTAISYSRIVTLWFRKNRGLALGIALSGISAVAAIAPVAMEASIRFFGWRAAFVVLAIWVGTMAPFVWIFLREPRRSTMAEAVQAGGPAAGMTRLEALRTRQFWLLAVSAFCIAIPISALIAHVMPLLDDRGLARPDAARLAALIGVGGLIGRIGVGILVDRLFPPIVAATILAAAAAGCLLLIRSDALVVGILLVGICLGSEGDLLAFFTSRYFGMKAFSELFGWLYAAFAVGFTFGPLAASALYDLYGSYDQALIIFGATFLFAAVLQLMLGHPAEHIQSAG